MPFLQSSSGGTALAKCKSGDTPKEVYVAVLDDGCGVCWRRIRLGYRPSPSQGRRPEERITEPVDSERAVRTHVPARAFRFLSACQRSQRL